MYVFGCTNDVFKPVRYFMSLKVEMYNCKNPSMENDGMFGKTTSVKQAMN